MPTIVAHHKVKDQKHWLASPRRKEFFGSIGVTNIRTFLNPTDPTSVALMMDVADMEKFGAAMQSKGAADAMAYDGVTPYRDFPSGQQDYVNHGCSCLSFLMNGIPCGV